MLKLERTSTFSVQQVYPIERRLTVAVQAEGWRSGQTLPVGGPRHQPRRGLAGGLEVGGGRVLQEEVQLSQGQGVVEGLEGTDVGHPNRET